MSGTAVRQGRRPARWQQTQRLGERCERGLGGGAATEPRHRRGEAFQRIAHERCEHRLAPALGKLLQAAEPPAQRIFPLFRRDPGQQTKPQPDDGMGVRAERAEVAHGVAHQQTVVRRERQEGRRDVGHGGIQSGKAAALDQHRKAARQSGIGQALHQFGERTCPARSEHHVEGAVEPFTDTDSAASPFGIADQQLWSERRWKRAILGRRGQARRCVVGDRHRSPIRCGRVRAVQRPAQGGACGVAAKNIGHDPSLGEQRREGTEEGLVPGREAIGRQIRALRGDGVRQPLAQPSPEPLAVAFQLVGRQHGRAGPGGDNETLGCHQRREATAAFGDHVAQREPEPLALPQRLPARRRDQPGRLVRGTLEHRVQRVAGTGKDAVEAARAEFDEAVEFPGAHHRTRAIEPEQRDQRAVAADQHAGPAGQGKRRGGQQKTLQRLFADRPAQPQRILDRAIH